MTHSRLVLLCAALLVHPAALSAQVPRLPALAADPEKVSVSGFSSGAFMAVQYDRLLTCD